jgi:hypothetical protein
MKDVGRSKAEVAAARIMERVQGVTVTPHHCRIEEKPAQFYEQFHVLVLGLDSLEARRFMNQVACSFLGAHAPARAGILPSAQPGMRHKHAASRADAASHALTQTYGMAVGWHAACNESGANPILSCHVMLCLLGIRLREAIPAQA